MLTLLLVLLAAYIFGLALAWLAEVQDARSLGTRVQSREPELSIVPRPSTLDPRLFLLILSAFCVPRSALAEIIPADRRTDWSYAGVPGGIPNRTTIYRNLHTDYGADTNGVTDISTIFQGVMDNCPENEIVYLPAGTYRINSAIIARHYRDNITIRGAGMGVTVLKCYVGDVSGCFQAGSAEWPKPAASITISGGATNTSTNIIVSSTSGVVVGKPIRVEQEDVAFVHAVNGQTNNMSSIHLVVSTNDTQITFKPPLVYTLTNAPRVAVYPNYLLEGVGFENLTIDMTNSIAASAIYMEQAYGCWFKNIEVRYSNGKQLYLVWLLNCEVRDSYFHDCRSSGPNHEGIDFFESGCFNLVENNICVRGGFPMIIFGDSRGGCVGNVVGYNYANGVDSGSSVAGWDYSDNHGPHNMMNLFEGNVGQTFSSDGYYGSGSHTTLFRNYFSGVYAALDHPIAINLGRWADYYNVVGNVLGSNTYTATYETEENSYPDAQALIYRLGYPNSGNAFYVGTNPPSSAITALDRSVTNTVIRHGNYDYATGSTIWDAGIADHALPNSYYLTSSPWPVGKAWPFNPATDSNYAQDRFNGNTNYGEGDGGGASTSEFKTIQLNVNTVIIIVVP